MAPMQISYPVNQFTSGRKTRVRLLVLHTTEGARTVETLGSFLRRRGGASYHAATDDQKIAYFVDRKNTAWHCRGANPYSDGFCLCGFAAWSAEEWMRHPVQLENAAWWLAQCSRERNIPLRHLTIGEVADVHRNPNHPGGVAMHWDYTRATGDGSHWDVGSNFPWDHVLGMARAIQGGSDPTRAPTTEPAQRKRKRRDPMAPIPLTVGADRKFRATVMAETGTKVADLSTITLGSTWGDTQFNLTALADGKVVAEHDKNVTNNNSDWWDVPKGARMVTIEGTASGAGTIPAAAIWIT